MQSKVGSVRELDMLDAFDEMASDYANEFGMPPFNVSHWDSLTSFTDRVRVPLPLSTLPNVLDYQYSYELTTRSEVVRKLGFPTHEHASLITPSGTSAIVCLLNLLRILQITNVISTSPVYFPVVHNSDAYGIRLTHCPMNRTADGFRLATPILTDKIPPSDAIWVTNPTYSTGVYLTEEDRDALERTRAWATRYWARRSSPRATGTEPAHMPPWRKARAVGDKSHEEAADSLPARLSRQRQDIA